ncbi:GntR family transcriptional regulator [Nocardiopsis flavescens]|uniref:GntR family transcriptional regulator n=1 Tax=Nocardiopsis flavescens TaxID=758803 RepID=UPI000934B31F|nr:GntR family transcriptional regulator [Nocardiopsis flavescens]
MSLRESPLYAQVAEQLREQIRSGQLAPEDEVPTERDLASKHGVSRGTAVKALEQLVTEGLVTPGNTRAGRRVRDLRILPIHVSRSERIDHRKAAGVDAWVSDSQEHNRVPDQHIDVGIVHADKEIARHLAISEGDSVAVRRRLRTLDGQPSNLADTYYPMDIAREIPEILDPADVPQGIVALMTERGLVQTQYRDTLRWRPPTPEEAQKLRIGAGVSVLIQHRVGYSEDRPVKVSRHTWPGDTIELIYELPA